MPPVENEREIFDMDLDFTFHGAVFAWPAPPLVAGDWTDAPATDVAAAADVLGRLAEAGHLPSMPAAFSAMRVRPLPFYDRRVLVELASVGGDGHVRVLRLIWGERSVAPLDGRSIVLHETAATGFSLDPAWLDDYLAFFCSGIRAGGSRFQVVASPDDILPRRVDAERRTAFEEALRAPEPCGDGSIEATILHHRTLFRARFTVEERGMVRMQDDTPLLPEVVLDEETFEQAIWQIYRPGPDPLASRFPGEGR